MGVTWVPAGTVATEPITVTRSRFLVRVTESCVMCPAFRGLELLESHATWMVRFIFSYSFGVSIPRAL